MKTCFLKGKKSKAKENRGTSDGTRTEGDIKNISCGFSERFGYTFFKLPFFGEMSFQMNLHKNCFVIIS